MLLPLLLRQSEVLRDAVAERPIGARVLTQRDRHVLGPNLRSFRDRLRDERVERLLLIVGAAGAEEDVNDDDSVRSLDP